ncbi:polysaccharide biosynthesis protein [Aerococcaceae bacterium DSM 111022]|nr:polysaccharide biosynthesis protein [Aerococcaceae bacterium DSM 111022]
MKLKSTIPLLTIIVFIVIISLIIKLGVIEVGVRPQLISLFAVYMIVFLIRRFSDLIVRLEFHSKLYSMNNIVNKFLYIVLGISLVLYSQLEDVYSLVIANIFSVFCVIVFGIYGERNIWNFKKNYNPDIRIDSKKLLTYSLPFVFTMGITSLFNANDKLFVNYYASDVELGIFSSATSLIALVNVIQSTFNTVWAPAAIEHYSEYPDDKEYHQKGNNMITVVMFVVGLSIILFKDIFSLILGEQFREASLIIPGLIFGPMMYTISETTVNGIVFKEKSKMHVIISLGAFIVDVIANSILVPRFGGVGAGLSTGFSYIVFFTLRTFISNRYYYVDYSLSKFYLLTFVSFGFAIYNSFNTFNLVSLVWYIICITLMVIFYKSTIKALLISGINIIKSIKN